MDNQEKLQLIEDVCLNIRWNLQRYWTNDYDYEEAMCHVKHELERLECLELGEPTPPSTKEDTYLLTFPKFGMPAYLRVTETESNGHTFTVVASDTQLTGSYLSPKVALDCYIENCMDGDFITDFVESVERGESVWGENHYAKYVQKRFECIVLAESL